MIDLSTHQVVKMIMLQSLSFLTLLKHLVHEIDFWIKNLFIPSAQVWNMNLFEIILHIIMYEVQKVVSHFITDKQMPRLY